MIKNVFDLLLSCEQSRFACKRGKFHRFISLSEKEKFQDQYDYIKEQDEDDSVIFDEMPMGVKDAEQRIAVKEIPFEVEDGVMVMTSPQVFYENTPKNFYWGKIYRFHKVTKDRLMSEYVCIVNVDSPRGILSFPREILEQALSPEDNRIRICLASVQQKRILKIKPHALLLLRDPRFHTPDRLQELNRLLILNNTFIQRSDMEFSLQLRFSTNDFKTILSEPVNDLIAKSEILNKCILESWYYDTSLKGWYLDHVSPQYPLKFIEAISPFKKNPPQPGSQKPGNGIPLGEIVIPAVQFFKQFAQQVFNIDLKLIDIYDQTYRFQITSMGCKFKEIYVIDCPDTDGNNNFGIADTAIDALVLHPERRNALLFLINIVGKKVLWVRDRFLLDSRLKSMDHMFSSLGLDSPDNDMKLLMKSRDRFVALTGFPLTFRMSMSNIEFLDWMFKYTYPNLDYSYLHNILGGWNYSGTEKKFTIDEIKPGIGNPQDYVRK